jgi:hypothetical protein
MGTGSFPGVKQSGNGADHPPPPSTEVKNEYSPSRPLVAGYRVTFTFNIDIYLINKTLYVQEVSLKVSSTTLCGTEAPYY